ncbi:unnamed protein product, partial [Discosporangium mesarthrocarpum]
MREMAKDLETQLAGVDRVSKDHETAAKALQEEVAGLREEVAKAKLDQSSWETKCEVLERSFKQVQAERKQAEAALERVREGAAALEEEKDALAERVEVEGAERVTVVAAITHERDFLLRQVNRLERELLEQKEAEVVQTAAQGTREEAERQLGEYRTRAQQALIKANKLASYTAAENKRLEVEAAELREEVSRERPAWEESKTLLRLLGGELEQAKVELRQVTQDRDEAAGKLDSMSGELKLQKDANADSKAMAMGLESQIKSLKHELQRQQKVLSSATKKEKGLALSLKEKESAIQALSDKLTRQEVRRIVQAEAETEKGSGGDPLVDEPTMPQAGEIKSGNRGKPPKLGFNKEMAEGGEGGVDHEQESVGLASFAGLLSDGDAGGGGSGNQLFYVQQLRQQINKDQTEIHRLIRELEDLRLAADSQASQQVQLERQLESALLAKNRMQGLDSGHNAAVNLEYLKNCVVRCLQTSEPSEHTRLLPVISTILKLSKEEDEAISKHIQSRAEQQGGFG